MKSEEEIRQELAKLAKTRYSPHRIRGKIKVKVNGQVPPHIYAYDVDYDSHVRRHVYVYTELKGVKQLYIDALKWVLEE